MLHAVAIKMATHSQSILSGASDANQKKIRTIVSGMVSVNS